MDTYNVFEWIVGVVMGATIVFALLAVLSLVFDGFSDKVLSWFRKKKR